jgi:hypothetical protein
MEGYPEYLPRVLRIPVILKAGIATRQHNGAWPPTVPRSARREPGHGSRYGPAARFPALNQPVKPG